jgi:hypothetical protein
MQQLFVPAQPALLGSPPMSSPPRRPAARRKTLAGMTISRAYGFSLRRASARLQARRRKAPVAKKAEALLCHSLGIVSNGQLITEQALEEFSRRFEGQVSLEVVAALRALFKLDDPESTAVGDALIAYGGAAALEAAAEEDLSNV